MSECLNILIFFLNVCRDLKLNLKHLETSSTAVVFVQVPKNRRQNYLSTMLTRIGCVCVCVCVSPWLEVDWCIIIPLTLVSFSSDLHPSSSVHFVTLISYPQVWENCCLSISHLLKCEQDEMCSSVWCQLKAMDTVSDICLLEWALHCVSLKAAGWVISHR